MKEIYTKKELSKLLHKSKQAIDKQAKKEGWKVVKINGRGEETDAHYTSSLPSNYQKIIAEKTTPTSTEVISTLAPEAAMIALKKLNGFTDQDFTHTTALAIPNQNTTQKLPTLKETWSDPEMVISQADLAKAGPWVRIIQEAQNPPRGHKRRPWIEAVAVRHNCDWRTIYKKIKIYEKKGLIGLVHRKLTRGKPKVWTPDALDFWVGLNLKRYQRHISVEELYKYLNIEAYKRSWKIGSKESALWWLTKRLNPQLLALQRGGMRALDNSLPPILRDYSDLEPFEILVGDQHRFDFWVVDEETGEVFRPECYLWQDLRTRIMYGCAIDRKYDAQLMGLSLRIGIRIFGAFKNIYTDNGKPEISRYIMGILKDMRSLGLNHEQEISYPMDCSDVDPEEITPDITIGQHRRAIVRNAKAKMIEGTFRFLEGILRDRFHVPGYVKNLHASAEQQEIDQKEMEKLAAQGKLLTAREFILTVFHALDYYNKEKHHRGVLREWAWQPKPQSATPMQCLAACCQDGWQPTKLSEEACDLLFLSKTTRTVDHGRVMFQGGYYEAEALISFNKGEKVDLRYDLIDPSSVLVFYQGVYICIAYPVEYSSMINHELANRKIYEKALWKKKFSEEYRALTSGIPNLQEYSKIPMLEKAAAVIGKDKQKRAAEQAELNRILPPEEVEAVVAANEEAARAFEVTQRAKKKQLSPRKKFFLSNTERFQWIQETTAQKGCVSPEDLAWSAEHAKTLTDGEREYWQVYREYEAERTQ